MPTRTNRQCANDFIKVFDNFMRTNDCSSARITGWANVKVAHAALVASRKPKRCTTTGAGGMWDPKRDKLLFFASEEYAKEIADALNKARGL